MAKVNVIPLLGKRLQSIKKSRRLNFRLHSARIKIIFVFYAAWFFLGSLLVINNLYAINQMTNKIEEYNSRILTLYINQIDSSLQNLNIYLYALVANDTNLPIILSAQTNISSSDRILASTRLSLSATGAFQQYPWLHSFFVFSGETLYVESHFKRLPSNSFKNELYAFMQDSGFSSNDRNWRAVCLSGEYYVIKLIPMGNGHICTLVAITDLMLQMEQLDEAFTQKVFLVSDEGTVLYGNKYDLPESVAISPNFADPEGKYSIVNKSSERVNFRLVTIYDLQTIRQNLPAFTTIILIIILGAVLIGAIFYVLLRHIILKPLRELQRVTGNILSGDLASRIENKSDDEEFYKTNESLNKMLAHIEELRIKVYDEQFENQQLEIEKLQQQIRPHFFLNTLNLIHNMAQEKDYALIQQTILSLSNYFRYRVNANRIFIVRPAWAQSIGLKSRTWPAAASVSQSQGCPSR
ncbi:MAG: histidine kinase, partial [Oscillospiraceae bacterium]|nr:histidine kinase [Oscillospiraceae bacterium]